MERLCAATATYGSSILPLDSNRGLLIHYEKLLPFQYERLREEFLKASAELDKMSAWFQTMRARRLAYQKYIAEYYDSSPCGPTDRAAGL